LLDRFHERRPRNRTHYAHRLTKRARDRVLAIFVLLFVAPIVYLSRRKPPVRVREFWEVVIGRRLLVGGSATHPPNERGAVFTVAQLYDEMLSSNEVAQIERYYATNESLILDCEILITVFRLGTFPRRAGFSAEGGRLGERIN